MGIIKKLYVFLNCRTSEGKIKYLRRLGCKIGENVRLNCNIKTFGTEPYLVEIGNDCLFAADVRFFTHDGGIKVLNSYKIAGGGTSLASKWIKLLP